MNQLEDIIKILDSMAENEVSRIKVEMSNFINPGETQKIYHHGRCDVGSPFATGNLYDLEEDSPESLKTLSKIAWIYEIPV